MSFIHCYSKVVTGLDEVEVDKLKCHEHVVKQRLESLKFYLQSLDGDILISSILVCDKSFIIIDGHHRYHALSDLGVKKIPITLINYDSKEIKAYSDDRILKSDVLETVNSGKLLSPKSTKHVIWDSNLSLYRPIILLSSIWHINLNDELS